MKIFSLQSKTNLLLWSVILGLFVFFIAYQVSNRPNASFGVHIPEESSYIQGLPFYYQYQQTSWVGIVPPNGLIYPPNRIGILASDIFFWILVVFIVLSLIRYFKYRKNDTNPTSAINQRTYQR